MSVVKIYDHSTYTQIIIKKSFTFFLLCIRKWNVNFGEKKYQKSNFYKYKNVIQIDDIDFNIHLYTLLDKMIKILLDHYA